MPNRCPFQISCISDDEIFPTALMRRSDYLKYGSIAVHIMPPADNLRNSWSAAVGYDERNTCKYVLLCDRVKFRLRIWSAHFTFHPPNDSSVNGLSAGNQVIGN
uniref:MSP domain-containing protein n=1 Tax=Ascaris lumbricoides TaxID=6252 RepID=A0A0M3IIC3_ASCLU